MDKCPCSSGKAFNDCCGPVLGGEVLAKSPEALMRARYTAHATGNTDFLYSSLHPSIREDVGKDDDSEELRSNIAWTGLEVVSTSENGNNGEVDFIANYQVRDIDQKHRERAKFVKEDGQWYYFDGEVEGHVTYRRESPKVGRNDPCTCGSGKKYKKCCG